MPFRWNVREHLSLAVFVAKWLLIAGPVAAVIGSACALFLWSLDICTNTRLAHPWLLWFLPLAGLAVGWAYHRFGRSVEGGNNLLMEQIHTPGGGVPRRMGPMILLGTLITHLFGGSAGREGTAIQMGGSIASALARRLHLKPHDIRILLMAGVAAGFGGVFGTPLAGAVFAMEVLAIGQISYEAIIPCLIASLVGDWACTAWNIHHTQYHISLAASSLHWLLMTKVVLAAVAFGLVSVLFAELTHGLRQVFKRLIPRPELRPFIGGLIVIALVYVVGTRDYLGLGISSPDKSAVTILSAFAPDGAHAWSWWWKILFTAITLSSGFKGGEVTPLFFIGATLGNVLAWAMGAPPDLFAGIGFVAVFAGATNTPLACTLMGIELFGSDHVVYIAVACFMAYLFSGHTGIYLSQRIGMQKLPASDIAPGSTLRDVRDGR